MRRRSGVVRGYILASTAIVFVYVVIESTVIGNGPLYKNETSPPTRQSMDEFKNYSQNGVVGLRIYPFIAQDGNEKEGNNTKISYLEDLTTKDMFNYKMVHYAENDTDKKEIPLWMKADEDLYENSNESEPAPQIIRAMDDLKNHSQDGTVAMKTNPAILQDGIESVEKRKATDLEYPNKDIPNGEDHSRDGTVGTKKNPAILQDGIESIEKRKTTDLEYPNKDILNGEDHFRDGTVGTKKNPAILQDGIESIEKRKTTDLEYSNEDILNGALVDVGIYFDEKGRFYADGIEPFDTKKIENYNMLDYCFKNMSEEETWDWVTGHIQKIIERIYSKETATENADFKELFSDLKSDEFIVTLLSTNNEQFNNRAINKIQSNQSDVIFYKIEKYIVSKNYFKMILKAIIINIKPFEEFLIGLNNTDATYGKGHDVYEDLKEIFAEVLADEKYKIYAKSQFKKEKYINEDEQFFKNDEIFKNNSFKAKSEEDNEEDRRDDHKEDKIGSGVINKKNINITAIITNQWKSLNVDKIHDKVLPIYDIKKHNKINLMEHINKEIVSKNLDKKNESNMNSSNTEALHGSNEKDEYENATFPRDYEYYIVNPKILIESKNFSDNQNTTTEYGLPKDGGIEGSSSVFHTMYRRKRLARCKVPYEIENSAISCQIFSTDNVVCRQHCVFGYTTRHGIQRIQRCVNGIWAPSDKFSDCKPFVDCTVTLRIGAQKKCHSNYMDKGPMCVIGCDAIQGYAAVPPDVYRCDLQGNWSPRLPRCVYAGSGQRLVQSPSQRLPSVGSIYSAQTTRTELQHRQALSGHENATENSSDIPMAVKQVGKTYSGQNRMSFFKNLPSYNFSIVFQTK